MGAFPMLLAISGLVSFRESSVSDQLNANSYHDVVVYPQSNLYLMFIVPIGRAYTTVRFLAFPLALTPDSLMPFYLDNDGWTQRSSISESQAVEGSTT